jgi:hypothetical protein
MYIIGRYSKFDNSNAVEKERETMTVVDLISRPEETTAYTIYRGHDMNSSVINTHSRRADNNNNNNNYVYVLE